MSNKNVIRQIGKWGGRLASLLLFLLWGAFFVEHLREWFLTGASKYPPAGVWLGMALHFLMIAGFALMLRWDRIGGIVALLFTIAFFTFISVSAHRFFPASLVNVVPFALFSLYWFVPGPGRNERRRTQA